MQLQQNPLHNSLSNVEGLYKEWFLLKETSRAVLSKAPESLKELVAKMKSLDYRLRELYVAQASKNIPVNIGGEVGLSTSDALDSALTSHEMAVRAQAKLKARPLLSKYHPDREGGDASKFDMVRKAVSVGDIEFVHLCLYKENLFCEESLESMNARLIARIEKYKGQPSFKLSRMKMSGSPDFESEFKKLLLARIHSLMEQLAS